MCMYMCVLCKTMQHVYVQECGYEPPDIGDRNQTGPTEKKEGLLTADPYFCPKTVLKYKEEGLSR